MSEGFWRPGVERKLVEATADPLTIELVRLPADDSEPDRIHVRVFRGELLVGSTEVYRGELLECMDDRLSSKELLRVSGAIAAEWVAWQSAEPAAKTIDLAEALKQALGATS